MQTLKVTDSKGNKRLLRAFQKSDTNILTLHDRGDQRDCLCGSRTAFERHKTARRGKKGKLKTKNKKSFFCLVQNHDTSKGKPQKKENSVEKAKWQNEMGAHLPVLLQGTRSPRSWPSMSSPPGVAQGAAWFGRGGGFALPSVGTHRLLFGRCWTLPLGCLEEKIRTLLRTLR